MKDREIQEAIEKYVLDVLPDQQEDALWVEFLKDIHWLKYYDTYLLMVSLAENPRTESAHT